MTPATPADLPRFARRAAKRAVESAALRGAVRKLVGEGRWRDAESDLARLKNYTGRRLARLARPGAESLVGTTVDLQGASFLTEGARVRRAVAFVEVNDPRKSKVGTGFLVSPRLFMTNCHVVGDPLAAKGTQITFDREMDEDGAPSPTTSYLLDPGTFALFSPEDQLDYALVAVGRRNSGTSGIDELGYCILSDSGDKHVIGMNVNIVQHPSGLPKMIAVRNNPLTYRTKRTLLYETDTETGSSGSPVFNDDWDLIALHHWGEPFLERKDDQGRSIPSNVNEGVRISAIYRDLEARQAELAGPQREMVSEALSYAKHAPAWSGPVLSPPRPRPRMAEAKETTNRTGTVMSEPSGTRELRVTIPIEVTIRMGSAGGAPGIELAPSQPEKQLARAAEAIQIDRDYANRGGYDPKFIPGVTVPLPVAGAGLAGQVAPLRAGEADAAAGELKYEHFSVKMNKGKRMAMFTATNIDGESYLTVDRKTGQVTAAEGETWFKDDRISASFFIDQNFYSAWSVYFDRGHLTRRTDPTWGTEEEAERANADTYHFTNCTPQHFRFNQTTKFWQGAERYVLEKGVLAAESKKRICVIQGPIFDDSIDHMADDIQIPSSFFKVIVWKGAAGLKAVGLIVDQLPLLSERRKNLGGPREEAPIDVSQWRVPIAAIQRRTGLDFGQAVLKADTIQQAGPPAVGAEAESRKLIATFDDILA